MASIDTLRVFLHPDRRRIIDHLTAHGPSRVGDIAATLGLQVGSVSHHLRMLEREALVERAADLRTDGRTSWWRNVPKSVSWSVDDFAEDGSAQAVARDMERANIQYQVDRLAEWKRRAPHAPEAWRQAAHSYDYVLRATPEELLALGDAIASTIRAWREGIDDDDGADRAAVRMFLHAFPLL
ncbi:hypothetical protein GCM10010915_27500 [Microbacterium faecale]|uniref:HTH arsR-type domain-containing protein n=1 Tax=Microbacterium faecale TaxID=1804630 RepID=A0A916YGY8_9MICO|nr:helix-turn-helix domain-containing protein [Microbacterium faecale]GGD44766.1 hypothetical protein GCM10010915_27500 [Microbacterium faecale]